MSYQEFETPPDYETGHWQDGKPIMGAGVTWFNANPPPPIGARVRANFNKLGAGEVVGYFVEDGFLGLLVKLEDPPAWHVKQNGRGVKAHLFGPEFEAIEKAAP